MERLTDHAMRFKSQYKRIGDLKELVKDANSKSKSQSQNSSCSLSRQLKSNCKYLHSSRFHFFQV